MNKLYRGLLKQARFSSGLSINIGTNTAVERWCSYNEADDIEELPSTEMMVEFTRLVVQECCNIVNKSMQINGPNDCLEALKIKEHFGLE